MPVFDYTGTGLDGRAASGQARAANADKLRCLLLDKGILLSDAKPTNPYASRETSQRRRHSPKNLKILAAGTRQFATMLKAGMPLDTALQTLARQSGSPAFKRIVSDVSDKVRAGMTLADALSTQKAFFGKHYIELVRAGEASGNLGLVLAKLADYLEKSEKVRRKIRAAIAYPATVFALSLFVVGIIVLYIVPTFSELFANLQVELPDSTAWIIGASGLVRENGLLIFAVVVALIVSLVLLLRTLKGRSLIDSMLLFIPGIRTFVIKAQLAGFSMTLATLLQGGVALDDALELASETVGNSHLGEQIRQGRDAIRDGGLLNRTWKESVILPPLFVEMASLGEQTGNMADAFAHLSDYFGNEVETMGTTIISLLEPVLILFVGLIVAGILIAMYLPLFDLVSSISL